MVRVKIWGSLRPLADGQSEIELEARTFKEVLDQLGARYPALRPQIKRGVSMALNGRIYRKAWFTKIPPESEVVLMPYMAGG